MQSYQAKTTYNNHTGPSSRGPTRKTITSDSTQNLWCRDTYWQYIVDTLGFNPFKETNGCHLRSCNHSAQDCRGAHTQETIKPLAHISKYNHLDKAKIEWVKLYNCVIETLTRDIPKVHNKDHLEYLKSISSMDFITLIQLWRNMACHYNKLAKELPDKKYVQGPITKHSSGFTFSDEVPKFRISDGLEDTAWGFERLTRWCPIQLKFNRDISENKKITVWDLCLATGLNCKEGIHTISEMICTDDFLTGTCSCPTKQDIETQETQLQLKLIELSTRLIKIVDEEKSKAQETTDDDWGKVKTKRGKQKAQVDPKVEINNEIIAIEKQIEKLVKSRSIHYTDIGMIPFNKQYSDYQAQLKVESEATASAGPTETKESWDHGLVENAKIDKPVVKVSKLGGKKK